MAIFSRRALNPNKQAKEDMYRQQNLLLCNMSPFATLISLILFAPWSSIRGSGGISASTFPFH